MGVRYRADWTNLQATEYRIDIIDTEYSSSVLEPDITTDGFTLRYDGSQDNPYHPILSSSVTLTLKSLLSDTNFQTFISDLDEADEERFILAIYKKSGETYIIDWAGYILTDLITDEDTSPGGNFTITATDGLKRLEGIDYDNSGTLYTDKATMLEHLFNVLNKIGLQSYWETTDSFLKTAVNWYENEMYTTAPADTLDPLTLARVAHNNFIYTGKDGELHAKNCYEVLLSICRTFGAKLKLSGGQFMFTQPNELINSTFKSRTYYKAGTLKSAIANEDFKFTPTISRTDGRFGSLPPLGKVTAQYLYKQGTNLNNLLPATVVHNTEYDLGFIEGGDGQNLLFSGIIHEVLSGFLPSQKDVLYRRVYEFKIKVGSYYFTNKDGDNEWTTDSADRYTVITEPQNSNTDQYKQISFICSNIPLDAELSFLYHFDSFINITGTTVSLPGNVTFTQTPENFNLSIKLADGNIQEGKVDYEAINTSDGSTPVRANSIYEHGELFIGDGPDAYSDGRIEVYDGAEWNNAVNWKIAGAGTAFNIGNLLVREIMAGRKTPVKTWEGKFTGDISAHHVIVMGSDYYVMLSAAFNANYGHWTGTWYKATYDNTNIVISDIVKYSEDAKTIVVNNSTPTGEFEAAFDKNTAFNKDFGNDIGDVVDIAEELNNEYIPYYSDGLKNSPLKTTAAAALELPACTTTKAPLNLKSGTLKTTPALGDIEFDDNFAYVTLNRIGGGEDPPGGDIVHYPVTIGTANGLLIDDYQQLSMALASGSTTGALSSTHWNTFNNKQNALTADVDYLTPSTAASTYLTSESDPVFVAHAAYNITSSLISNWNTAYGWGNHASAGYVTGTPWTAMGYLTSETSHANVVVDTDFASNGILKRTSEGVYGIITDNSSNWNTAYGWGDHASAGYQDELVSGTNIKTINSTSLLGSGNIDIGGGGEMVYPGAGIPLSTGSAWGTSITNNSANWNTAYGWGNHASAGYLTSETSHADVVVDGDFTSNGILKRTAEGVYGIITDNSSNWNTAYGWGDHASAGYQDELVSGTNIKTINSTSLLGSGNIDIEGTGGGGSDAYAWFML